MSLSESIMWKVVLFCLMVSLCIGKKVDKSWQSETNVQIEKDITNDQEKDKCLTFLPFDLQEDLEEQYDQWYGLLGKNLRGNNFQIGHALERHIAVDGQCTQAQVRQRKTVFLDVHQFLMAAQKIPALCSNNMSDHKKFTFDYNGEFTNDEDFIIGIDCKTGQVQIFRDYFVEFKRAIRNPQPTHEEYEKSNYVTFWTFYPKR